MLNPTSNISYIGAVKHGIRCEPLAVSLLQNKFPQAKIQECGLSVHPRHPFLAASPDRLISFPSGKIYVVEVKCPFSAFQQQISHETVDYLELESGNLQLKKSHQYYYQIQGQLACCQMLEAILVIYTGDIKVIKISRDDKFVESMISKLVSFYNGYFKAAFLKKFLFKNTPVSYLQQYVL